MKTIDEIQNELNMIVAELERLKKKENVDEQTVDFTQISARAKRYPMEGHPLFQKDNYTKKKYITLLLTIAQYDDEHIEDSLMLAHRVAWGAGYLTDDKNLNDEFIAAKLVNFKQLDEWSALFLNDDIKMVLVLEQLMTAGMFDKGRTPAIEFISSLCILLDVDKRKLTFLANMARVILTNDAEQYSCDINNEWDIFDCYLKNIEFERKIYNVSVEKFLENGSEMLNGLLKVELNQDRENEKIYIKRYYDGAGTWGGRNLFLRFHT